MNPFNFTCGFLPEQDPLKSLSEPFNAWEKLAAELPKELVAGSLLNTLSQMPDFPTSQLTPAEYERAMLLLSFIGHGVVWGGATPVSIIPKKLALPWFQVSQCLKRPPVLSYASYALHNWRRIDVNKPVALGNIVLLQNFLGGIDEEWFVLVHVEIEARAHQAISVMLQAEQAVVDNDPVQLLNCLNAISEALTGMCQTLHRMPEHCDPYIYYNRVRPYIHGWKDSPALPSGIVYEGVDAYQNQGQHFRGETGAQSSIVPALDAVLGVHHNNDFLTAYLQEMRDYMPEQHREFIIQLESGISVRNYVIDQKVLYPELRTRYNECVTLLTEFRQTHFGYAAQYIQKQAQTSLANPTQTGTGGTPFMDYLRKHKEETDKFRI